MLGRADAVADDLLHRRGHVVVEETVHGPHAQRDARVLGDQPHRSGMTQPEMLDDDARLHDGATLVHEHGHALERPQGCVLGRDLRVARREHAELEWSVVLVERDQHLLAVGREGVGVELHRLHPVSTARVTP